MVSVPADRDLLSRHFLPGPPRLDYLFTLFEWRLFVRLGPIPQPSQSLVAPTSTLPLAFGKLAQPAPRCGDSPLDARLGELVPLARAAREPPPVPASRHPLVVCSKSSRRVDQFERERSAERSRLRRCAAAAAAGRPSRCRRREQRHGHSLRPARSPRRLRDLGRLARARSLRRQTGSTSGGDSRTWRRQ